MSRKKDVLATEPIRIDVFKERVFLLSDLGKHLPYKPGYQTIWNWIYKGRLDVHGGERCFMDSIFLPNGLASSIEAYQRFVEGLNRGGTKKIGR